MLKKLIGKLQMSRGKADAVYLESASNHGDAEASYLLGMLHFDHQSYFDAARFYKLSVAKNHASSQCNLGAMHLFGLGMDIDCNEAVRLYKLSADQEHPLACCVLGKMLCFGENVERNYNEALKHLCVAGANKNAEANGILGMMYYQGKGVHRNYQVASKLLRLAAEQGVWAPCHTLAEMYRKGLGVKESNVEAIILVAMANIGAGLSNRKVLVEKMVEMDLPYEQGVFIAQEIDKRLAKIQDLISAAQEIKQQQNIQSIMNVVKNEKERLHQISTSK